MKTGYKTSEFWVTMLYGFATLTASATANLSPHTAAIGAAVATVGYSLSRAIAKAAASWGTLAPPPPTSPLAPPPA